MFVLQKMHEYCVIVFLLVSLPMVEIFFATLMIIIHLALKLNHANVEWLQ